MQALADADLQALGRLHTVEEALAAVRLAASLFPRFSFDLIYGRPGQTVAAWRAELARALDLAADHISLYQLTIEPDTPFERLRDAGKLVLPGEDASLALFDATRDLTEAGGCPPMRFPTTRAPAPRAGTISSIGATANMPASAPARMAASSPSEGRLAQACERAPERWLGLVEAQGHGLVEDLALTPSSKATSSC